MLFSQDQFNVSGRCCRNVVVDQQRHQRVDRVDKLVSIESTRWCRSNGFKLKRSFTGIRKVLEKRIAPGLIYGTFHVEMTYVFLILSSDCQYFLRFWLSNCHDLWPVMQAVLLTFKYFQRADNNKLQQQGPRLIHSNVQWSTQVWFLISPCRRWPGAVRAFNDQLKSDSWFRPAGGCQELLGHQTALSALLRGDHRRWRERARRQQACACSGRLLSALAGQQHACSSASASSRRLRVWAPAPSADVCPRRAWAGASTCQPEGCRRQAADV